MYFSERVEFDRIFCIGFGLILKGIGRFSVCCVSIEIMFQCSDRVQVRRNFSVVFGSGFGSKEILSGSSLL